MDHSVHRQANFFSQGLVRRELVRLRLRVGCRRGIAARHSRVSQSQKDGADACQCSSVTQHVLGSVVGLLPAAADSAAPSCCSARQALLQPPGRHPLQQPLAAAPLTCSIMAEAARLMRASCSQMWPGSRTVRAWSAPNTSEVEGGSSG